MVHQADVCGQFTNLNIGVFRAFSTCQVVTSGRHNALAPVAPLCPEAVEHWSEQSAGTPAIHLELFFAIQTAGGIVGSEERSVRAVSDGSILFYGFVLAAFDLEIKIPGRST